MPTSLLYNNTMNSSHGNLDEARAYQLALELSMFGIGGQSGLQLNHYDGEEDNQHYSSRDSPDFIHSSLQYGNKDSVIYSNGGRKSANMTEAVPVPSSEHVAEIVGRQGCKIKALRAKTNTYIKTPVRGAEPVFVVTGRKEDVAQAKHEILSAAEHFSQIRASRRTTGGSQASNSGSCSPTSTPGHITLQVRVPYKVVGLVVGPKGATIKRIQQTTSTYIVTPGRDKEPVFEVTGLPESVEKAKEEIEKHIASRTGTDNNSDLQIDDFNINGIDSGYHDQSNESANNGAFVPFGNAVLNVHDNLPSLSSITNSSSFNRIQPIKSSSAQNNPCNGSSGAIMKISSDYKMAPFTSFNGFSHVAPDFDVDEGIGTSGGSIFDPTAAIWSDASSFGIQRSNSISVSSRILPPGEDGPHPRTRRTNSDPLAAAFQRIEAAFSSSSPTSSQGSMSPVTGRRHASPHSSGSQRSARGCIMCGGDVTAALVPCGHNSFCMTCADEICKRSAERRLCPICHESPSQAILIRHNC